MMAFETPEVEVVGFTTIFGNVATEYATRNALLLVCACLQIFPSFLAVTLEHVHGQFVFLTYKRIV